LELPNFLQAYAEPALRERLAIDAARMGAVGEFVQEALVTGRHDEAHVRELVALGDGLIAGPKGYSALGAFNPAERSQALDLLGFEKQLVFASLAELLAFDPRRPVDDRYAAARAHNGAMADFCRQDPRLYGVALLPLDVTQLSLAEIDHILALGLKAAWVPHRPCGGRSPGHSDLDKVWAKLAEAGLPFVLHVAGAALQAPAEWMNTGRPVPTDWLGGGENIHAKDMLALHHEAEIFIGAMVMDGVFERHPQLRGAVVELGAGWVPSLLRRLDWVVDLWRKSEPELAALKRRPSEQVVAHLAFTPYVYEDVGALIRQSDERLYLFSSDYPHPEGGRAPLARFEASLDGCTDEVKASFYADNFSRIFGA
jgi:predicted TIM-barrel fold metal-dependent hydrolase